MRKLWLALFLLAGLAPAKAQVVTTWPPPAGTIAFLCVYNSSVPTPTNGSPYYAQCDGSGNLRVTEATDYANTISSSVTRPANTTTYTANTGWCTLASSCVTTFVWANACRANGGSVIVPNISVWSSANPSTKLQGILWMFNTVPGTIISDDITFSIIAADFANLTGGSANGIPFTLASSQASGAANSGASLTGLNYQMSCASGSTTLYGMVQVVNAYVPASAEVLTVKINTIGLN